MNETKKIAEIIELWKADKKRYVKKSTFSAYMLLIENHLNPAFGDNRMLTEAEIQAFVLKKLNEGLSQKSVKDILIVLKMALKFGAKHQWIEYRPFDIQYPTEREKNNMEVLSRADQKKVMGHVQQHFTFRNLGIYICLSAGVRIGEICALTWDDVDTDNGIIHVRRTIQRIYTLEGGKRKTEILIDTPKTKNSIREIPMNRDLIKMLKPMKKIVNSKFFMLTNDLKPTEPRTYRSYYQKFMRELNMPKLKFHGL